MTLWRNIDLFLDLFLGEKAACLALSHDRFSAGSCRRPGGSLGICNHQRGR